MDNYGPNYNPFDPFSIDKRPIFRVFCHHLIPEWRCTTAVCHKNHFTKTYDKCVLHHPTTKHTNFTHQSLKSWSRP